MTGRHTGLASNPPYRPRIERRRFLLTSLAGALGAPLVAGAQPAERVYRVGLVSLGGDPLWWQPVLDALRDLGYVDGRNLVVKRAFAQGLAEDLHPLVVQLVSSGIDVAVTTATRSQVLPDLPTVAEFLPGYETSAWFGVGAPRNTPTEIIDKLNREINTALADRDIKARFADLGGTALPGSPIDFGKLIADETEKWAKVVAFSGVKVE